MVKKMLTKEECEKALEDLRILERKDNFKKWGGQVSPQVNCDVFERLIKEHFELLKSYEIAMNDLNREWHKDYYVDELEKKIETYENSKPYKFEELKKGMWVWDNKGLYCFKCNPAISKNGTRCVTYNAFWYNCGEDEDEFFEEYDEFEEGRFFPITKALEYQE